MPPKTSDQPGATGSDIAPAKAVSMADIASEILVEHEACERAARNAIDHAIRCGQLLVEAKAQVKHGEWRPWLEANFPASERTARGYVQLAANRQRVADLDAGTVRGALAELAEPRPAPPEPVPVEVPAREPVDDHRGDDVVEEVDGEVGDQALANSRFEIKSERGQRMAESSAARLRSMVEHGPDVLTVRRYLARPDLDRAMAATDAAARRELLEEIEIRTRASRMLRDAIRGYGI